MNIANTVRNYAHHPLMISLYIPSLLTSFGQGLLVPIMPLYAADFEISYALIGLVLAGFPLGRLLGDVPAGLLVPRMGNRRVQILGVFGMTLTTVMLFWAQSIFIVFLLRFVAGFSQALYNITRHTFVADRVVLTKRGRALSIFGGVHRFGTLLGPIVAGVAAAIFGLRVPFLLFGVASGLALLLIYLYLEVEEPFKAKREHTTSFMATMRTHYRVLASAGTAQLFGQAIRMGRQVIVPLYAADVLGLDTAAIGFIVSFASGIDTLFFPVAGWIMDKWGRKRAIIPCFGIQTIGMALIPFTANFGGLLLAVGIMGFGNGLGSGTMMTLGSDLAPEDAKGEFIGVWRLIGDGGMAGTPLIVGGIADLLVLPAAAGVVSGIGLVSVLMFAFLVPETLKRKRVEPKLSGEVIA